MFGKVLLVGDDTPAMRLIASRVSSEEVDVQRAASAGEALAIVERNEIDVMVLNFMDLMSEGLHLIRSLKKKRSRTEVITLSAPSGLRYSIEGMKLGVFEDFFMPFDLEDLVSKILKAWEKGKAKRDGKSLRQRFEDFAVAVSFAEAGDYDAARRVVDTSGPTGNVNKEEP